METCRWEYRVVVFKNNDITSFEARLNDFGVAGWELVTLSTTVKTWVNMTGNDLVAVLKRPSEETADRNHVPVFSMEGAWHPDPVGRHEQRWWDGAKWTEHVQDGASMSTDPLPADTTTEH